MTSQAVTTLQKESKEIFKIVLSVIKYDIVDGKIIEKSTGKVIGNEI